jgi:pimeloyl-ACP methyl ester carboxylesterase
MPPNPLRLTLQDISLQGYEWPGEGRPILFAHATGFHARCWDQVIRHLPGRHIYALDMRGHGLSDKPEPPYRWHHFGADVAGAARALGLEGAVGVGHSGGGYAVTLAATLDPTIFAGLVLVDPVIMSREAYNRVPTEASDHFAARRRNNWSSPDEMFASFKGRGPFASWEDEVLRDYCDYGLIPAADGEGFVLACPPIIEASIYTNTVAGEAIYDRLPTLDIPVRILRARPRTESVQFDMSSSPTAPDLASHFPRADDVFLPHMSHFIPMEDPALVARHVRELLDTLG